MFYNVNCKGRRGIYLWKGHINRNGIPSSVSCNYELGVGKGIADHVVSAADGLFMTRGQYTPSAV